MYIPVYSIQVPDAGAEQTPYIVESKLYYSTKENSKSPSPYILEYIENIYDTEYNCALGLKLCTLVIINSLVPPLLLERYHPIL
jgi:hypothetical protein